MNMYITILKSLLWRDWLVFMSTYKDRFINNVLWIVLVGFVYTYIMPHVGLKGFDAFIIISSIGTWGLWNSGYAAREILSDLEGERSITYYLTLPLPQTLYFVNIALSSALQSIAVAFLFIPVIKLLLWNTFSLSTVHWFKFILAFVLANIFYGFFTLFLVGYSRNVKTLDNMEMRIVWPMFYLGCYSFPWSYLYNISPIWAYLNILNPMVPLMEGIRAATFGQKGSLPFWPCIAAVVGFTALFGYLGIKRLKKRLDCL